MGYISHRAILVTGDRDRIEPAHAAARLLFARDGMATILADEMVSPILHAPVNGYCTFLIGPDGSKAGWEPSDWGDQQRAAFRTWLEAHWGLRWVEVQYGDDGGVTRLVHGDDLYDQGGGPP